VEFLVTIVSEVGSFDDITVVDDLETMFRAHYGRLVRTLALVAGSQEAAADAVQEAFVKAHLHWRRVQRYEDPVGWIRRVAINKLRDENRRQGRKERAVERLQTEVRSESFEWSDGTDVGTLLAELPRQQRLAMALFYVEGLSVAEVADTLKLSEGAVRFHLHQGRNRLRGQMLDASPNSSLDDTTGRQ
jgi:RNA polymerase sigma-70 factor (ECF subfamily)